jgi:hypothetical protein
LQAFAGVRYCVHRSARQRRARAGRRASLRRSPLRSDCPAVLGLVARRQTHFAHCVRYVQTSGDKSVHEARCARGPRALRSSAPQRRPPTCPSAPLRKRICSSTKGRQRCLSGRRCPAGAISGAARSGGSGSARAARFVNMLAGVCLNAANEVSEVSLTARPWTEHHSGVGAKRRPPQHEPTAGTACRDAQTPRKSGHSRTAAMGRKRTFQTPVRFMRHRLRDARWSS